jgi:ankyrin repeat protein
MIDKIKKIAQKGNVDEINNFLLNNKIEDKEELKLVNHIIFTEACRYGYLDVLKFIIEKDTKGTIINNKKGEGFKVACACGRLEVVKYLLTDKSLKHNIDIKIDNDGGFRWACEYNQLEVIKYLLASPDLKIHSDINVNEDFGFIKASEQGYIEIAEYLLTNKDLKQKPNLNARDDYAFRFACKNEHKDVVKLLLQVASQFNTKINIYAKDFQVLKELIKENKYDMLVYLITDLNLFDLEKVQKIVKKNPEVMRIFERRELNKNLNANLKKNEVAARINKI